MNTVEEALADIKAGKIILVVDDEDREYEGDLVVAAEKVTAAHINFMATHGRGLVCMPMTQERADELSLGLMVSSEENTESHGTAFTVSIDAKEGTTTGISAADRAATIRKAIGGVGDDFRKPGHVFPLIAKKGGVLVRQGHTEAVVDLVRLAGLKPLGVLCEILNEDGSMAKGDDLVSYAEKHHLKVISVADVIRYRVMNEKLVSNVVDVALPTTHGSFMLHAFKNSVTDSEDFALVKGELGKDVVVRIHSECLTGEVFGSLRCDCDDQLQTALCAIEQAGAGILIYLRQEGRGIGLVNKLKAYALQDQGLDTVEANEKLGFQADGRSYWIAAQILMYFGVQSVRLLSNNVDKVKELEAFGIKVRSRLALESVPTKHNVDYLKTKQGKMGHLIDVKDKLMFL
jgi:3,4-dihydroxy 2-butanone 4-phosphate synthase / GTP cyclohydrolase II